MCFVTSKELEQSPAAGKLALNDALWSSRVWITSPGGFQLFLEAENIGRRYKLYAALKSWGTKRPALIVVSTENTICFMTREAIIERALLHEKGGGGRPWLVVAGNILNYEKALQIEQRGKCILPLLKKKKKKTTVKGRRINVNPLDLNYRHLPVKRFVAHFEFNLLLPHSIDNFLFSIFFSTLHLFRWWLWIRSANMWRRPKVCP